MKKISAVSACIVASICLTTMLASSHPVFAASGTVSTDQAIYPIWKIGGTITGTAQNLAINTTYYIWLQKPKAFLSQFLGAHFTWVNGTLQVPIALAISPSDPAGTYTLSLSTSRTIDTGDAVAHFGVLGTDSKTYERTEIVTIAGGGFAPNSSITLDIRAGNNSYPAFPVTIAAQGSGEFGYTFKLPPSAETGTINATITGLTYDKRQSVTASSFFTVKPTTITAQAFREPASQVQRTVEVNTTYRILYADKSPVTDANASADIMAAGDKLTTVPLVLVNSTTGEWRAAWTPPLSANVTTYHFQFSLANFTDAYGNTGHGIPVASSEFNVSPAKLQVRLQTNPTFQRTQTAIITLSAIYPDEADVSNVTLANVIVTRSDGQLSTLIASVNDTLVPARYLIPVNASLGNYTLRYSVQDLWGNSGANKSTILIQIATPTFQLQTPPTTERTTLLNVTTKMYYPNGTPMNSTAKLMVSHGNRTWTPEPNFNSTTLVWSGSLHIVQNATLGPYNITWATHDSYGNGGINNSTTEVIPARFRFHLTSNNSTMNALSNLDLNVTIRYPNGTTLTNMFGNVTGHYTNSTGNVLTLPLAYNETDTDWHMYFQVPEEGNLTFSFNAVDRFGNTGLAANAYNLKIIPSQHVVTQSLIIAGVIGALVPVALLIWAIATISTRRRKHRP
jgi:hypothetical protein